MTTKGAATPRRTAIVTGGARRVGRAIALAFASAGFDVVLTYRTRKREAEETAAKCRGMGVSAEPSALDMRDSAAMAVWCREMSAKLSHLDALVHNAAVYEKGAWGAITAEAAWEHVQVNTVAPLLMTQGLTGVLKRTGSGACVVLMCDMHAMGRPYRGFASYFASKAGAAGLVAAMAKELAPEVRVNGIAPGVVAWPEDADAAQIEAYEKRIPLGRPGTPEDAAKAVLWLASEAKYVTGEIIRLDGGRWLG